MIIAYSKNFIRMSKKLDEKIRLQLVTRIELFSENPLNYELNNHPLKGRYKQYRSVNITGNYHALYLTTENEIIFDLVGTHSQLYG